MTDFSQYADQWHDNLGPLWTLHQLHAIRCDFIKKHIKLNKQICIDLACGGGLMTKFMAEHGCLTYGFDLHKELLAIAKAHTKNISPNPVYQSLNLENEQPNQQADIIIACEIIEHLNRPIASFIEMLTSCCNKHGHVIISSLNKTWLSKTLGIWLTEEILHWLPSGTHQHEECIALNELLSLMHENFELVGMQGLSFNPITQKFITSQDVSVHYLCCFRKKNGD